MRFGHRNITEFKATHPWMTQQIVEAKIRKKEAEGTDQEAKVTLECSELIRETREDYIRTTRDDLQGMKKSSKL